jgi:hypothetical protein
MPPSGNHLSKMSCNTATTPLFLELEALFSTRIIPVGILPLKMVRAFNDGKTSRLPWGDTTNAAPGQAGGSKSKLAAFHKTEARPVCAGQYAYEKGGVSTLSPARSASRASFGGGVCFSYVVIPTELVHIINRIRPLSQVLPQNTGASLLTFAACYLYSESR